jgi:hypothetical protein
MIRTIKALGLSAMALLLVGAFAASASAAEFHSESINTTTTVEQEGTQNFTAAGGTIECTKARFEAKSTAKTTASQTFTPLQVTEGTASEVGFGGCTFLGIKVNVAMNGCDFKFFAAGTVDIECTTPNEITYKVSSVFGSCEVRIPDQKALSAVTYTNVGAGTTREITVHVNISGIKYSNTGSLCPKAAGTYTDGKYVGTQIATGEVTGTNTHTPIWWE